MMRVKNIKKRNKMTIKIQAFQSKGIKTIKFLENDKSMTNEMMTKVEKKKKPKIKTKKKPNKYECNRCMFIKAF